MASGNYKDVYAGMSDDQLLNAARSIDTLIPEGSTALREELSARNLSEQDVKSYTLDIAANSLWQQMKDNEPIARSTNGTGTMFYGKRDFRDDQSYITTKWIAFCFVPILPLKSFRVRKLESKGWTTWYAIVSKEQLSLVQVISTYGYIVSALITITLLAKIASC